MTLFVDTSAWYAAADAGDATHDRAKSVLSGGERLITTDHVLLETWLLMRARANRQAAMTFWGQLRAGVAQIEPVRPADLEAAWGIGEVFADQDFSIVDCTSFAVMERLGLDRAASFDDDFAVYRYGPGRRKAFTMVR